MHRYSLEALENLPEPLFLLDSKRIATYANKALCRFLGIPVQAHKSLRVEDFWPECSGVDFSKDEITTEFELPNGKLFSVKLSLAPLSDGCKLIRVIAGLSHDETSKNFHAQRLETLGVLAGGIAHDFNNILTGIMGHITYLKAIMPQKGTHIESLAAIEEGAQKAAGMTQQILNFSKLDTNGAATLVNVGDLITRTCGLLRRALSPLYQIDIVLPAAPLVVKGVEGQLAQILVNLVINGRDASPKDSVIRVSVAPAAELPRSKHLVVAKGRSAGPYLQISVEDSGHGMDDTIISRIFEPYFTTKKNTGTGLGLATVHTIVMSHQGAILVESEIGKGTRMSIFLPRADGEGVTTQGTPQPRGMVGGTERILVVDDEHPVRSVLSLSLQRLGYSVAVASSGEEALTLFSETGARYDLVILDMVMPHLSGSEVFFKLQEINPQVRVLISSGYSSEGVVQKILDQGGLDFIQKPFTIEELAKKVRKCLDM